MLIVVGPTEPSAPLARRRPKGQVVCVMLIALPCRHETNEFGSPASLFRESIDAAQAIKVQ